MDANTLVNYYRLCGIFPRSRHIINDLNEKQINVVFSKKEIDSYLRTKKSEYVVNEYVIGSNDTMIIVIC